MRDQDCVVFLQDYLPRLGLRWSGYRKVRRTVCKRLSRRLRALNLESLSDYGELLARDPKERTQFDALCRIPISRFYRDRQVFVALGETLLPDLAEAVIARGKTCVRAWSAGCASGEEPYSVKLVWDRLVQSRYPDLGLEIFASDADQQMLERAEVARYTTGSLKDLPAPLKEAGFVREDSEFCLRPEIKTGITFVRQDIRTSAPACLFDLILCRNLAFTYFDKEVQGTVLARLNRNLRVGGMLVIGAHEHLPAEQTQFERTGALPIYKKR